MKCILLVIAVILINSCSNQNKKAMIFYDLHTAITSPEEIKALKIDKTEIDLFERDIKLFPNLEALVINNKNWVIVNYDGKVDKSTVTKISLPNKIAQLSKLKILVVNNYYVDSLPNQISNLKYLESLKLSYTREANIIEEANKIKSIKSLKEVDLTNSLVSIQLIKHQFDNSRVNLILANGGDPKHY